MQWDRGRTGGLGFLTGSVLLLLLLLLLLTWGPHSENH